MTLCVCLFYVFSNASALRVFNGSGRFGPGGGQCGPMRGAQMGPARISEALASSLDRCKENWLGNSPYFHGTLW